MPHAAGFTPLNVVVAVGLIRTLYAVSESSQPAIAVLTVALPLASSVMSGYDCVVAKSTNPVGAVLFAAATLTEQSRLKIRHWKTPFGGPLTLNVTSE